jgi:hypothetical protein
MLGPGEDEKLLFNECSVSILQKEKRYGVIW